MTKTKQIDNVILQLKAGKTIHVNFQKLQWILLSVERYKLGFDLKFITEIPQGGEIILTGIKKEI